MRRAAVGLRELGLLLTAVGFAHRRGNRSQPGKSFGPCARKVAVGEQSDAPWHLLRQAPVTHWTESRSLFASF